MVLVKSSLASSRASTSLGSSFGWFWCPQPFQSQGSHNIYQEVVTREADHDEDSAVCQNENKEVTADEENLNVKIVIRKQNPRGDEIFKIKADKVENTFVKKGHPRRLTKYCAARNICDQDKDSLRKIRRNKENLPVLVKII